MTEWLSGVASDSIKDIAVSAFNWFVEVLPDIVGYSALATGAFVILSSLVGNGIMKPLGAFTGISILAVSILVVA